jgi:hypothetical protein
MVERPFLETSRLPISLFNRTVHCKKVSFPNDLGVSGLPAEFVYSEKGLSSGRVYVRVNENFIHLPQELRETVYQLVAEGREIDPSRLILDVPISIAAPVARELSEFFKKDK